VESPRRGFTILELLLALALLVVLLSMLWSMVQVFSDIFVRGTQRAGKSQLVRSLSQLLHDDLGSAIQDPIHPSQKKLVGNAAVRRFGLNGNDRELRIDVVQINPFKARPRGKREDSSGGALYGEADTGHRAQAPELKTVFYQFEHPASQEAISGRRLPGLVRKELDFETPTDEQDPGKALESIGGTMTGPSAFDAQTREQLGIPSMEEMGTSDQSADGYAVPITEQLEENLDEATMWAPEVVDCRFRYYDGKRWSSSWNSLRKKGLPVAVEVTLELMPLEDVDVLTSSPLLAELQRHREGRQESDDFYGDTSMVGSDMAGSGVASPYGTAYDADDSAFDEETSLDPTAFQGMAPQTTDRRIRSIRRLCRELDLAPPVEQRLVMHLPTTPLLEHRAVERPRPPRPPKTVRKTPNRPKRSTPRPKTKKPKRPKTMEEQWIRGG
jgi:prepilin-type N-terminal cleavage/methylation domain-containing protein